MSENNKNNKKNIKTHLMKNETEDNKKRKNIINYINNSISKEYILIYLDNTYSINNLERAIRRGLEEHIEDLLTRLDYSN